MPNPSIPRTSRSESVIDKLALLRQAYESGRLELVESLADSIKDSTAFDRQANGPGGTTRPNASHVLPVQRLPRPWTSWAAGWEFCYPLRMFETVGIQRSREPMEMLVGFRHEHITDCQREIRVARADASTGQLQEVPSQVWDDGRRQSERVCRLAFLADVPQHGESTYIIFFGNPHAELPNYATDLHVDGDGLGLNIENEFFTAQLSRQMGQLERLTSKREHGLELYAGGKGHGEPPTIDWAHDYVEHGGYQKLRMKNWSECRNYQIVRGPVCVQVRRWGFPHSPLHPLISPSRMHLDVTYSFWAGLPVFFKRSTMEAIVDFQIDAMRDDEWVFSGYSFTKSLWIDAMGRLHEGPVPAGSENNLWGVGFANDVSGDSFMALWLEHEVSGRTSIGHSGPPTLHYDGHGQLWSRYPAHRTNLKAGTAFWQRNAYLFEPWSKDAATRIERERHRWTNALEWRVELPSLTAQAATSVQLTRRGEMAETAGPKPEIWKALREVRDDQIYDVDANIVDLGYVYDVRFRAGVAHVIVTMPHRGRPVHQFLVTRGGGRVTEGIRERLLRISGVHSVTVECVWNPPWSLSRITDAGRRAVGMS